MVTKMSWIYPPDDLWCEFLDEPDGYWSWWFYGNKPTLQVNTKDYTVGALSIELVCYASPYMDNLLALLLKFREGRELDLTEAETFNFWVKLTRLGDGGGFNPYLTVILHDPNWYKAEKTFSITSENWIQIQCGIGPKHAKEWVADAKFDWTKVVDIWFYVVQTQGSGVEYMRIDGMFIEFLLNVAFITVESNPFSGVPVRLNEAFYGTTPVTFSVEPPGVRTVTVDETYDSWIFDHWDDGTTTPGRVVDATEPGFYRVTAFYAPPPTPPPRPTGWKPGYLIQYILEWIQKLLTRR